MDALHLLDWRRQVAAMYADVRAAPDPATGHVRWRRGRNELFARHPSSPLLIDARGGFSGLPVADYDPAFRFDVVVEPAAPEFWSVETGTDGTVEFERVGTVALGSLGTLGVWRLLSYGNGLFVPLKDATSAHGSYGGGRYVVDTVKGADLGSEGDRLAVDLNFAYAPSCAYDPAWACPLPPAGNTLTAAVPVGELSL